jgi:N-acetyl-gamma-glutamyl-phosphate reductase
VHIFTKANKKKVLDAYKRFYKKEPFIRVMEGVPSLLGVKGSNYCHIGGIESDGNRIVIFSAIDNLVKGASGQAVQNMNIAAGFDETLGLESIGGYP